MPVDFGYVVDGFAAGIDLSVVFSDGDSEIFGVETRKNNKQNNLSSNYIPAEV